MLEAEREDEIVRENNLLLRKMQVINNQPGKLDKDRLEELLPHSHGTLNEVVRNAQSKEINEYNEKVLSKI